MTSNTIAERRYLGHGIGLRVPHYGEALAHSLPVDWVECITENFLGEGGRPRAVLKRLHGEMPIVFHGVAMGIGSAEPPDRIYLQRLKRLFDEFPPAWVSDHLCWTHWGAKHSHDLLPLPYTDEALRLVVDNVRRVQDTLNRPLLLENVSSYVGFNASTMAEWEFLAQVADQADCLILLDLNNVVVSAKNHDFQPRDYLDALPAERVTQFHLANSTDRGHYKFDSHLGPVPQDVWHLYEYALGRFGAVSSLVEWDEQVPPLETLVAEQRKAKAIASAVLASAECP